MRAIQKRVIEQNEREKAINELDYRYCIVHQHLVRSFVCSDDLLNTNSVADPALGRRDPY